MASNLNQTIKAFKDRGVFVIGLDGDGDMTLPQIDISDRPLLIVVGSEGKGLTRLVTENCDAIVSIPIGAATESLNAGIATSITLYEIAMRRGDKR
jgi:23S rRNA (guanosine2251-2'-O)-methyltransferase